MNDNVVTAQDSAAAQIKGSAIAKYSATERGLAALRTRLKDRVYDVTTTKGLDEAKRDRAELRTLRVSLDKLRKQLNEDDQVRINTRNGRAKEITAEIEALEEPIDQQIKKEESRKEGQRAERARAEAEALRKVNAAIDEIRGLPVAVMEGTADEIQAAIDRLAGETLESFDEVYLPTAQQARDTALETLRRMHAQRVTQDAEAERLRAEREELDRLRAEQEQRDREAEEQRAAQEEADRIARGRRQAIDEHIRDLRDEPRRAVGGTAAQIRTRRDDLATLSLTDVHFGDRVEEAEQVRAESLDALNTMLADAEERERVAAEQAERKRQLDEQEEAQRLAAEKAAQEEAERRAEQERDARKRAEQQEADAIELATLVEAATEARDLLTDMGHAHHITTRKLSAALSKEAA